MGAVMADNRNIAYAHESHRTFNRRFDQKVAPKPLILNGPWLSTEALNKLPRVRQDFEGTRDPANQQHHIHSAGQSERGSTMVKQERPHPAPHPVGPLGDAVDRQAFRTRWLAEQRDAVLARAVETRHFNESAREVSRASQEPSR